MWDNENVDKNLSNWKCIFELTYLCIKDQCCPSRFDNFLQDSIIYPICRCESLLPLYIIQGWTEGAFWASAEPKPKECKHSASGWSSNYFKMVDFFYKNFHPNFFKPFSWNLRPWPSAKRLKTFSHQSQSWSLKTFGLQSTPGIMD